MGAAATFIVAAIFLGFFGILTPTEIIKGLGNEQIAVIIMLLIVGDIIRQASIIEVAFDKIFSKANSYKRFVVLMMAIIAGLSAFLNNTPLVAIMMPYVHRWSKRNNVSPSKLLIPLSYAAILGGCATLIGTSTNLIVNGLVVEQNIIPEMEELGMFDFSIIGFPMIIIGILFLLVFGNKLLPNKESISDIFKENAREYLIETKVISKSKLIGKTIEQAELKKLKGLYLVEIRRKNGVVITAPSPGVLIFEEDMLIFAGDTESIAELIDSNPGLSIPSAGILSKARHTEVHEVVISHNSTLITKTVQEANFRGKYDSAVIGIHRNGERIKGAIGDIPLRAGDVLIIIAGPDIVDRKVNTHDFYFLSMIKERIKQPPYKIAILIVGLVLAIALSAFKLVPLFLSLLTLISILLAIRLMNPKDLPASIDYNLGIIIAMALALGMAMMKTGVAQIISDAIVNLLMPYGVLSVLIGLFVITSILAAYITNKASVALLFPIALTLAKDLNADPKAFAMLIAFAGAANFMTPIGYQTNLMVYGPGNYSFKDFFRIGFPLTLIYGVVTVGGLYWYYF